MRLSTLNLRMLQRDWRAGELRLLLIALVVAVASVTSVGFFTDRIDQALHRQANELLGGDLLIVANHPIPIEHIQAAEQSGLSHTQTISFLSMVLAGERNELADIKAVSAGYPLRGQLRIAERAFAAGNITRAIPMPGTVWLDARLLNQLGLHIGDMIALGEAQFTVAWILVQEPDRSGDFFSIAPRLLMNINDVAKTQLIQVGSRVSYRLQIAGAAQAVKNFRNSVEPQLKPGERLQGIEDARPEVRSALERAQRFLGLAALVSVLLACVAVAGSARRFTLRHLDDCAIMRCLGATQGLIVRGYVGEMLWLGLVASIVGCVIGYLAQTVLADVLGSLVAADLPTPSWRPILPGLLVGMITLLGFAVPPLLALKNVPTLRVLRREIDVAEPRSLRAYALGLVLLAGLMLWQAGDIKLGLYLIAGSLAAIAFLAGVAFGLVRLLNLFRERGGLAWRFGLANIARRAGGSVVQVVALGLGIMALLLLTLVRGDLLASWQDSLPIQAPNRFIINIQPEQVQPLQAFFARHAVTTPDLYPMVRGRLVKINNRPVTPDDYQEEHAARLVEREFNLSWMTDLPSDNRVIEGRWWGSQEQRQEGFSVEEGIATTLGLKLGDTLSYSIGGTELRGTITSLRKVDWDTFRVNFFVIATPKLLRDYPTSYITSFYLPEDQLELLNSLVQTFPNLTIIDVAAIMTQVRHIIERVSLAVEYVFLFTVLAGLLVLYAAIQATQDERMHEGALLRMLGASRRQLLRGLSAEFVSLGLLAGLVAALAASLLAYILAKQVLHLAYALNPWLWLAGMLAGVVAVMLVGALGLRPILNHPPLQTLRRI
ncbi:MAG TPA: FtsX-like permease family protein [Gammaproteobacteria bacterium]|nr:FtsX-like permease family protein [Gammaproteobacteria bacterium]